jgi:hypothetical protein
VVQPTQPRRRYYGRRASRPVLYGAFALAKSAKAGYAVAIEVTMALAEGAPERLSA